MARPPSVRMSCPRCGRPLVWLAPYGHWYCDHDQLSYPATLPLPAPPRPPPVPPPVPPPPMPFAGPSPWPRTTGVPGREAFLLAAIGNFLSVPTSIALGLLIFVGFYYNSAGFIVAIVPFLVGMVLQLFGFYGQWRRFGSALAAVTFAYGLPAIGVFAVGMAWYASAVSVTFGTFEGIFPALLLIVVFVMLGILFLLEGVTLFVDRIRLGAPDLAVAAGILLLLSGALIVTVILSPFGMLFLLTPGFVLTGVLMMRALILEHPSYPPPP